jgi:hypothetical protein
MVDYAKHRQKDKGIEISWIMSRWVVEINGHMGRQGGNVATHWWIARSWCLWCYQHS